MELNQANENELKEKITKAIEENQFIEVDGKFGFVKGFTFDGRLIFYDFERKKYFYSLKDTPIRFGNEINYKNGFLKAFGSQKKYVDVVGYYNKDGVANITQNDLKKLGYNIDGYIIEISLINYLEEIGYPIISIFIKTNDLKREDNKYPKFYCPLKYFSKKEQKTDFTRKTLNVDYKSVDDNECIKFMEEIKEKSNMVVFNNEKTIHKQYETEKNGGTLSKYESEFIDDIFDERLYIGEFLKNPSERDNLLGGLWDGTLESWKRRGWEELKDAPDRKDKYGNPHSSKILQKNDVNGKKEIEIIFFANRNTWTAYSKENGGKLDIINLTNKSK